MRQVSPHDSGPSPGRRSPADVVRPGTPFLDGARDRTLGAMSDAPSAVHAAIDRWEESGLVPVELAQRLREEVALEEAESGRRLSRYVLAVTGGILAFIAGGVLLSWAWPRMTVEPRAVLVAFSGIALQLLGTRLEWRDRWLPASYAMQAAGLALVLMALIYSREAWPAGGLGAAAVAVLAVAWVVVSSARAILRSPVMPAVHLVFFLAYLAVALRRAFDLEADTILWILDGVLLVEAAVLGALLQREGPDGAPPWVLTSFSAALYAGFVLVGFTSALSMDWEAAGTVLALDLWFVLVLGFALWGLHGPGAPASSAWFPRQMALLVLGWIPLGFLTAFEVVDGPPEVALVLVAGAGVPAFLHGDRFGLRGEMTAAALAFVSGAWYWGAERAGALGAVGALVVTAGLLFWLSGRWGGREDVPG